MNDTDEFVDAIKDGDDVRLSRLLGSTKNLANVLEATITNPRPTNHSIGFGMTLLQFASYRPRNGGDPAGVLLDHGAKIDLHSACGLGMVDRITEILSSASDAMDHQVDGFVPMQMAISAARPEAIQCLVDHGDDPSRDLIKVAYFGWEDDTRDQRYTPWKPIHMASLWGFDASRVPVAAALAAGGADLNVVAPLSGYRPIHLVAMPNRVDMIRFIVSRGVDVDSRTTACDGFTLPSDCDGPESGFGCTPLMVAAAEGFVEATACLLELGADAKAQNDLGMTAMDFATNRFWKGQPYDEVIALLAKC